MAPLLHFTAPEALPLPHSRFFARRRAFLVSTAHPPPAMPTALTSAAPHHVAVIMDGNGRWAKARHLPRAEGHRQGVKALYRTVRRAAERGVRELTVFAFSSENWRRPAAEVSMLMRLFAASLRRWSVELQEAGVALRVVGERAPFGAEIVEAIVATERATAGGRVMRLNVAANYGGRWDMCQAAAALAAAGEPITPEGISARLATAGSGDVDLLIRTGGEQRISNFLLWQAAYAELYVTDCLWPDFGAEELDRALAWFEGRERRFGMTSEQLREGVGEESR